MSAFPRVGVGVGVLTDGGYVLLQRGPGKHGAGEWSLPGGALEMNETVIDCARREIMEEIGVELADARILPFFSEDFFPDLGQHWITLYVVGRGIGGSRNLEPHKATALIVRRLEDFPRPLFVGVGTLIEKGLLPARLDEGV